MQRAVRAPAAADRRGTSGAGRSILQIVLSNRFSYAISSESRNPAVVTSAVRAPLRSISALVANVVPWMTRSSAEAGIPASARIAVVPQSPPLPARRASSAALSRSSAPAAPAQVGERAADIDGQASGSSHGGGFQLRSKRLRYRKYRGGAPAGQRFANQGETRMTDRPAGDNR